MTKHVNYRKRLLAAVEAFLEQTPQSYARAHRLVQACSKSLKPYTLNRLTWGSIVSALRDSLYFENPTHLSDLRTELVDGSRTIHRVFIRRDFREDLTVEEQAWIQELWELLAFLRRFPRMEIPTAASEYVERTTRVTDAQSQAFTPAVPGDETVYHLLLREVTTILIGINLQQSLRRYHYMVSDAPYSWVTDAASSQSEPDVSSNVAWADQALRAIRGEHQLFMTWQLTRTQSVIVLV